LVFDGVAYGIGDLSAPNSLSSGKLGTVTAILGPSGAGKSTCSILAAGF